MTINHPGYRLRGSSPPCAHVRCLGGHGWGLSFDDCDGGRLAWPARGDGETHSGERGGQDRCSGNTSTLNAAAPEMFDPPAGSLNDDEEYGASTRGTSVGATASGVGKVPSRFWRRGSSLG